MNKLPVKTWCFCFKEEWSFRGIRTASSNNSLHEPGQLLGPASLSDELNKLSHICKGGNWGNELS